MDKNPFSLFDFLGYFIPGAFALFLIYFLQNDSGLEFYFKSSNIDTLKTDLSILYLTFFIILAYTLGHFLSFLSTLTIENFTVWMFGYPSKNILGVYRLEKYLERKMKNPLDIDWKITVLSFLLRLSLFAFLAPISITSLTIGNLLDLNNSIYKKPVKAPYVDLLRTKITQLFKKLDNTIQIDFRNHDYNKLLIHHSYHVCITHQSKLMNYIALYGFLRVMSLIFNILSIFLFYQFLNDEDLLINFKLKISEGFATFFTASFFAYVSYLGYLKFYRRYTQENLMILLLDK